jgi:hypothetical protein
MPAPPPMPPRDHDAEIALLTQDREALRQALVELRAELRRAEEEATIVIAEWKAVAATNRQLRAALSRCQSDHACPCQGRGPDAAA